MKYCYCCYTANKDSNTECCECECSEFLSESEYDEMKNNELDMMNEFNRINILSQIMQPQL